MRDGNYGMMGWRCKWGWVVKYNLAGNYTALNIFARQLGYKKANFYMEVVTFTEDYNPNSVIKSNLGNNDRASKYQTNRCRIC